MVQSHPSPLSFSGWFSLNTDFTWDFGLVFLALLLGFLAPTDITVCFRWATLYLASYLAPITVVWKHCYGFITTCRGTGHEVKTWNRALGLGKRCETSTTHSSALRGFWRWLYVEGSWTFFQRFQISIEQLSLSPGSRAWTYELWWTLLGLGREASAPCLSASHCAEGDGTSSEGCVPTSQPTCTSWCLSPCPVPGSWCEGAGLWPQQPGTRVPPCMPSLKNPL